MATERKAPDAILDTDLTGVVSRIQDDPDSPDANWLTTTNNNSDHYVRVSFPTPTGSPTVGAGLQEFRAQVRKYGGSGTPTARIELWENGSLIRAGSDTNVGSNPVVLSLTWNANEIATGDGSLVECRVYGTKTGGSPSKRASIEVGAVEWNVTYSAATPVTVNAVVASSTASVPAPSVATESTASVTSVVASSTASAPAPTVTAVREASVTVPVILATASSPAPSVGITASVAGELALATASAPAPGVSAQQVVGVSAPVVLATGTLPAPSVATEVGLVAPVLGATASAPAPTVGGASAATVAAVVAACTSTLPVPVVSVQATVNVAAVVASATGTVLGPVIGAQSTATVVALLALATARAGVPSISAGGGQPPPPATGKTAMPIVDIGGPRVRGNKPVGVR